MKVLDKIVKFNPIILVEFNLHFLLALRCAITSRLNCVCKKVEKVIDGQRMIKIFLSNSLSQMSWLPSRELGSDKNPGDTCSSLVKVIKVDFQTLLMQNSLSNQVINPVKISHEWSDFYLEAFFTVRYKIIYNWVIHFWCGWRYFQIRCCIRGTQWPPK